MNAGPEITDPHAPLAQAGTAAAEPAPALAPHTIEHPSIRAHYVGPEQRRAYLTEIFDATASDYDRVERWLSLGSGRWYRGKALRRAGLRPGDVALDVAVGTGLVAREALAIVREGGASGRVVGIDPSAQMLALAVAGLGGHRAPAPTNRPEGKNHAQHTEGSHAGFEGRLGRAERLEFPDASFDFVSMGYALRHMDDLRVVFAEQARVLKPGGRVCVLEITRPEGRLGRAALKGYLRFLSRTVGRIAGLRPRTGELWEYYYDTIDLCVPPQQVMAAMTRAGFEGVKRHRELGLFSEFTGLKPSGYVSR